METWMGNQEDSPVSIEITREGHRLSSVSIIMPTWNRVGSDGKLYAKIPFLGVETYGINEADLEVAVKEAITCFCIVAEKHGMGLESELARLGWGPMEIIDEGRSLMSFMAPSELFESVLSTGDSRALVAEVPQSAFAYA